MRFSASSYSRQTVIVRAISWSFCTQRMLLLETGSSSENETKRSNARLRDASRGQKAAPQRKADPHRSSSRAAANAGPAVADLQRAMPAIGHRACATGCSTPICTRSDDDTVRSMVSSAWTPRVRALWLCSVDYCESANSEGRKRMPDASLAGEEEQEAGPASTADIEEEEN